MGPRAGLSLDTFSGSGVFGPKEAGRWWGAVCGGASAMQSIKRFGGKELSTADRCARPRRAIRNPPPPNPHPQKESFHSASSSVIAFITGCAAQVIVYVSRGECATWTSRFGWPSSSQVYVTFTGRKPPAGSW